MNGTTLLRLTRGNHLYRVYQKNDVKYTEKRIDKQCYFPTCTALTAHLFFFKGKCFSHPPGGFPLEKKRWAQRTFSSPKENVLAGPGAHRGENIPNLGKFEGSLAASLDFFGCHIFYSWLYGAGLGPCVVSGEIRIWAPEGPKVGPASKMGEKMRFLLNSSYSFRDRRTNVRPFL